MIKRTMTIFVLVLVTATFIGTAIAEEPGNKRKGKYTYRKVYKACFERGAVDSKTPPISPADKTMAQWEQIFESKDFARPEPSAAAGEIPDDVERLLPRIRSAATGHQRHKIVGIERNDEALPLCR